MNPRIGVVALMLALSACGDEDHSQTGYTPSADKNSVSADDSVSTPAPAAPTADDTAAKPLPPQLAFGVALAPLLSGSPVRGAGQVKSVATSTAIATTLAGGIAGATYDGAVREGVCARIGAAVAGLIPLTADSLGAARSSGDVPVPTDSFTKRPHVIVYGRGGRPELCGSFPAMGVGTTPVLRAPPPPDTTNPPAPPPTAPDKPAPRPTPGKKQAAGDTAK